VHNTGRTDSTAGVGTAADGSVLRALTTTVAKMEPVVLQHSIDGAMQTGGNDATAGMSTAADGSVLRASTTAVAKMEPVALQHSIDGGMSF
jgi:hypothetical protein